MICRNCGQNSNREITVYKEGTKLVGCRSCIKLTELYSTKIMDHKTGTMTVAHRADIEARKLSPDGREVYRDRGRKFI